MPKTPRIPALVAAYGVAGVIPFWACAVAAAVFAPSREALLQAQLVYAAAILSFLAGARFAAAIQRQPVEATTLSLSMVPPVLAWAAAGAGAALGYSAGLGLGMAAGLAVQGVWDRRAPGLPAWYPRLRLWLTLGAVSALTVGALV